MEILKTLLPIHYHTNYRYEMNKSNVTNHIAHKLSRGDSINIITNTLSYKLSRRKNQSNITNHIPNKLSGGDTITLLPIHYHTNYRYEIN